MSMSLPLYQTWSCNRKYALGRVEHFLEVKSADWGLGKFTSRRETIKVRYPRAGVRHSATSSAAPNSLTKVCAHTRVAVALFQPHM